MSDFIPLNSSIQSAQIDQSASSKYFIDSEVLMESAGALAAREVVSHPQWISLSVTVLCGPGHNGGDGLVLARHLHSYGIPIEIFCSESSSSPLIEKQKKRLTSQGLPLHSLKDQERIQRAFKKSSLLVDALFGVGLSRNIKGDYLKLIQWINSASKNIVSLDTPSGLNADTGRVRGQAVRADLTLSFGLFKPGFYLMEGPTHTGQIVKLPLGFPPKLFSEVACTHFLIDEAWVSSQLPKRSPIDHKARQGHLLVLAGQEGFWGAGRLCAESAYRMGCGYVTWSGGDGSSHPPLESAPDVLTGKLSDKNLFKGKTAIAIGPGLGTGKQIKELLLALKEINQPVVVDADALTVLAHESKNLFPLPENWILTPHSGELGRLFNLKGEDVDQDRCFHAMKASQKTSCLVLLKGFHSVLASRDKCWIIPSGNSALAKAGTGDVLTGFIGALLARSLSPFAAASVGAFVHGLLADNWLRSGKDADTLMAQDLKDLLPETLQKLRSR